MPKPTEKDYFKKIGQDGVSASLNKPFSDDESGALLAQIGAIMRLLPPPPATVLDLGCGTGWTSCFFARRGYSVVGQDLAPDAIAHARRYAKEHGIPGVKFVAGDYETMDFGGRFAAVVFFDSLHHAVDETAALRVAYRALKPGGICITSEPGTGHAAQEQSQEAIAKYGVTEKDMPPKRIIKVGKRAGFSQAETFADAALLSRAAYRQPVSGAKKRLLGAPVIGGLARSASLLHAMTLNKRHWGIVVLTKP